MKQKNWITVLSRILCSIGIIIITAIAVFCIGRYGWKLAGFNACQSARIEEILVSDTEVTISGVSPGLLPEGFIGYYAKEEDGKLYVGFRFNSVFGFFETGRFSVQIPISQPVDEIYIKTKQHTEQIWSSDSDDAEPS